MKHVSFCRCYKKEVDLLECHCGEEYGGSLTWLWDKVSRGATLADDKAQVNFHKSYSNGTAIVRGDTAFKQNCHYYWELKILTKLYGTDVMIGVGTDAVQFDSFTNRFCSLLAMEKEAYGYSFKGNIGHDDEFQNYGPEYGQGSLIGVHLDMCAGTLEFYNNRKPLGIAYSGLKHLELYPMVCSTAAHTCVRVTSTLTVLPNLEFECVKSLFDHGSLNASMNVAPGLRKMIENKYWWYFLQNNEDNEECITDESSTGCCIANQGDYFNLLYVYGKRTRDLTSPTEEKSNKSVYWGGLSNTNNERLNSLVRILSNDTQAAPCEMCGQRVNHGNQSGRSSAHHFSCSLCLDCS